MNYINETKNRYRNSSVASAYKDGYEGGISLRTLRNKIVVHAEKYAIVKALSYCKGIRSILDIPCGTGKLTEILRERSMLYVAADVSLEMIQQIHCEGPLPLIQSDGMVLPFRDKSFDAVVSLRLIHRLPSEIKTLFIRELMRVSGKYIIFSFPKYSLSRETLRRIKSSIGIVPDKMIMESIKGYSAMLNQNGFELVKELSVLTLVSNQYIYLYQRD